MSRFRKIFYGAHGVDCIGEDAMRRGERAATLSACWGSVASILLSGTGIVILYAEKLDAGQFVAMATTSLQNICGFLLIFPVSFLFQKYGVKPLIMPALIVAPLSFLLITSAAWFGTNAKFVLLAGISIFSVAAAIYVAGWYPLLQDVVNPQGRGKFFGRMRLSWQVVALVFLLFATFFIGRDAPTTTYQAILFVAAIGLFGRYWYIRKVPERKFVRDPTGFLESFRGVIDNTPIVGFSVYTFCLYLFAGATEPVIILFGRYGLRLGDNQIAALSFFSMGGAIAGYFLSSIFVDRFGTKAVFLLAHFGFGLLNATLLLVHSSTLFSLIIVQAVVALYGMLMASSSVAISSETFVLASASRFRNLSLAFCVCLHYLGSGLSRIVVGWVLHSGMLSPKWSLAGYEMTVYHTLFLFFACGVTIACILLSLVPAIVRKVELQPGR
jgi:MFS family permease